MSWSVAEKSYLKTKPKAFKDVSVKLNNTGNDGSVRCPADEFQFRLYTRLSILTCNGICFDCILILVFGISVAAKV